MLKKVAGHFKGIIWDTKLNLDKINIVIKFDLSIKEIARAFQLFVRFKFLN